MHSSELHRTGTKSSSSLQLSKNNVKQSCCHLEFAFNSNSSSNFWSFRRLHLGKAMRDALEKRLSTGAEDGRVAFNLRKRSLTDGKPT